MDTLFFIASKLVWSLIRPETWIVIGLFLTWVALLRKRPRGARRLTFATLVFTLAVGGLPLGDLAIAPLETRYPANPPLARVDGIVILGGGEDRAAARLSGQPELNEAGERYTAALALATRHPGARVLFTGGSGRLRDPSGTDYPEASLAGAFFADQGLAPERLILEGASRNTVENARLSLPLADPQPGETWVLVTSGYHMPRAVRSFERAGWPDIVPYPVDHRARDLTDGLTWDLARKLEKLNIAVKEYIGLVVYGLTGR
ncbi:MAG: YdcF family protein [Paracoccaceae bacterium]